MEETVTTVTLGDPAPFAMTWGTHHGHAERRCRDCAERFWPRYGFERYCFPCWQDRQDDGPRQCIRCDALRVERDQVRADRDAMRAERDQARANRDRLSTRCAHLEHELGQARFEAETLRAKAERAQQPAPPDWPHMLPRLIQLAHPDRHGNSRAANDATRWLLEQRAKLRR